MARKFTPATLQGIRRAKFGGATKLVHDLAAEVDRAWGVVDALSRQLGALGETQEDDRAKVLVALSRGPQPWRGSVTVYGDRKRVNAKVAHVVMGPPEAWREIDRYLEYDVGPDFAGLLLPGFRLAEGETRKCMTAAKREADKQHRTQCREWFAALREIERKYAQTT